VHTGGRRQRRRGIEVGRNDAEILPPEHRGVGVAGETVVDEASRRRGTGRGRENARRGEVDRDDAGRAPHENSAIGESKPGGVDAQEGADREARQVDDREAGLRIADHDVEARAVGRDGGRVRRSRKIEAPYSLAVSRS
jgi:hypothetical protein